MSNKMASSSKWTLSQLLDRNRTNPAWNNLTNVMKTSSEEFGLVGKRSENYETAITQVMNQFDALKAVVNDAAIRAKIGDVMIHNLQNRVWLKKERGRLTKIVSRQNKLLNNKKKGLGGKARNKREKDESNSESKVKVKHGSRKSTKVPSSSDSQPTSPLKGLKLCEEAEKLLVLHRPLSTWKRLMALMRMTSENLGIAGLQDEKSLVAIAGIMANFSELRPHMDDVSIQKKIRRQMITNLSQRLYLEKKKESLECPPKMKSTVKKQRRKKVTLKVKTLTMSAKDKKDKPKHAKKELSTSIQTLLPSVSATKKLKSTQLISELSVKARQLLFYRHPPYTHQRLRKMMRQTGDQLGIAGLRSSEGSAKIIQIMEAFPQLQPYVNNVHVLKKLQSQMIMNFHQRKRNKRSKLKSEEKAKENCETVTEKEAEKQTSDPEEDETNTNNSTRQVSTSESKQQVMETEGTKDTVVTENEERTPLAEKEDTSKTEKDETFENEIEEKDVLEIEKKMQDTEEEKNWSAEEAEDTDAKEEDDDQTTADEEGGCAVENIVKITAPENVKCRSETDEEKDLTLQHTEKDADEAGNKDKDATDKEEIMQPESESENTPPATEEEDVSVADEEVDPVAAESLPSVQTSSQKLVVGKSTMKISEEAKQLLVYHRPYKTWKQLRDLMRSTSDELGLQGLREPEALKSVKQVMKQIPQLQPYRNVILLQQRLQKQMINNLAQRMWDHKRRNLDTYQPKDNVVSSNTKWRQTRLLPVKRKNLKDITENNKVSRQRQVNENNKSSGSGKCWCQKGRAATWTYNDILYRASGSLPWRHLMNVMKHTASALNVNRKGSENYETAVLEVMNHFPGLRKVTDDVSIRREIGKRMIKNDSQRRRRIRSNSKVSLTIVKKGRPPTLKNKEKFLKRNAEEKKKQAVTSDDQEALSENSESGAKLQSKKTDINRKKCWCQKKAAASWTYDDILIKTMGNVAWRHFTKIMHLTARSYNITKRGSAKYNTGVTEVINHFPALRPFVRTASLRREIGRKMIRNYYRLLKRHNSKSPNKEADNSTTEKEQQDVESDDQNLEAEKAEMLEECKSNEVSRKAPVKKPGVKKCWCQNGASSTWTCNDLLVRTPGNQAWRHFVKILLDTSQALNVTKRSSVNYQTAIVEIMNHFPALKPLVGDDSVQQKIGDKMVKNYYERCRNQAMREKTKSGADEGSEPTTEGAAATGDGQKPGSIKEAQIFEVEAVLKYAKDLEGGEWYYVKWAGYASDQNTWEPTEHLTGCSKLLKKFHHQLKRAKLTHSGRKRKLSDDGLVVGSKKPKWPKPMSPVSTEAVRAMVQEELRNWAISLNYICSDTAPIVVENDVDFEGPPTEFNYINDYISGAGVKIPNDPLVGCECESCSEEELECCPQNSGVKFAYNRLKHIRVKPGTPIYECNKYCKCGEKCPNRVVQLGRKYPMAIFRTSNGRGWGVKTLVDIRRNTFVMEYVGEVITNEEAERRGKEYDANGRTYLFDLDYNDDDCPFTVDAGKSGNISHFVNHSCEPNLVVYGVWVNCVDPRLPRIALFANKDIKAGEELTFDYQMTGEVGDLSADVKVQHVTCRCGASNCRGFLV